VPIAHRCELRLADRFGTPTGHLLPGVGIGFSVGIGGAGFLSCEVDSRAEPVASAPDILDDCVIRLAIPLDGTDTPTEILPYAPRTPNGVLWDGAGGRSRSIQSAPTLWTAWAQDAILYTESNNIPQMAAGLDGQRYFGFQSSFYDFLADAGFAWSGSPSISTGQQDSTTGDRAGNPDGWPTALGNAYWITRPAGTSADLSRHLFVADVVVPTDSYCTVYFSADESCAVYFGGELVLHTSSSETGYQNLDHWSAWVLAGTYRVAIDKTSIVSRGGDGVDPVLLAVATNHDNGSVDDILLVTNNADWWCYALHPVTGEAPSLTPGEILLELHAQAAARGVNTWAAITPTFTAAADSLGTPWGMREERTSRLGYDRYLDIVEQLGDTGLDQEIDCDLHFNAYYERGVDRSATVTVAALDPANPTAPGVGVDDVRENGAAVAGTHLEVETQDGWVPGGLANAAAVATYGRRETSLSLGNAPSIAQGVRLGRKVLDERLSQPAKEWSIEFYAVAGAVPFRDFGLADTISVRIQGVSMPRVVLEIGGSAPNVNSIIRWTAKTGPVLP
jgi:hypothetical protein